MCSRNHGDVVLTAGKSIKLWDAINQTLIKVSQDIYIGTYTIIRFQNILHSTFKNECKA